MDTKWKKCRIIVSFMAFFLGMTLLLVNFFSMLRLLAETDYQAGSDYQRTEEFADYMSGRLETLISAAAGGENWDGGSYSSDTAAGYVYEEAVSSEAGGFDFSDWMRSTFGVSVGSTEVTGETTAEKPSASIPGKPADQGFGTAAAEKACEKAMAGFRAVPASFGSSGMVFPAFVGCDVLESSGSAPFDSAHLRSAGPGMQPGLSEEKQKAG